MDEAEEQAEQQGIAEAINLKSRHQLRGQQDDEGVDHQQKQAQAKEGDGDGEQHQQRLHKEVEQHQHGRYQQTGEEVGDGDARQEESGDHHRKGADDDVYKDPHGLSAA